MKISLIGPGVIPIPPVGWGAVEILIWDYAVHLREAGHEVQIVNTRNRREIIDEVNCFVPDFIHIQYDEYVDIANAFICQNVAITSHYGYIDRLRRLRDGYFYKIFLKFLRGNFKIYCLSESIQRIYLEFGVSPDRLFITPNGVSVSNFDFTQEPKFYDRSIYLAKIDARKRQSKFQGIDNKLYFAGNIADSSFNPNINYLGEWTKKELYSTLTEYANLVLLSDGEAHPLVCAEALCAGLGLVISEFSCANLDLEQPFIDVIPESRINDLEYIAKIIKESRLKSISCRQKIRDYGLLKFDYKNLMKNYLKISEKNEIYC